MRMMNLCWRRKAWILALWGGLLCVCADGCGRQANPSASLITNADLELPFDAETLPAGWSLSVPAGTYRAGPTGVCHSGKNALVLAGTDGRAEIETNSFSIPRASIVECEAWVQTDMLDRNRPTLQLKFPDLIEPIQFQTVIPVDAKIREWQRIRFCRIARGESAESTAQFIIGIAGGGLVRIDDLKLTVHQPSVLPPVIGDRGFEEPMVDGGFLDWELKSEKAEASCTQSAELPYRGKACVRLQGTDRWGVMVTRKGVPQDHRRIFVQGFLKVKEGKGCLKIDYFKGGQYVGANYSSEVRMNEWQFVYVENDPELSEQADEMRPCLAAGNDQGNYVMDFDEVELHILQ